jgi:hypothetical protein
VRVWVSVSRARAGPMRRVHHVRLNIPANKLVTEAALLCFALGLSICYLVVGTPVDEVHDGPELLLLLLRLPPRGRRAATGGRRQRVMRVVPAATAGGPDGRASGGALLGRPERVVPAAQAGLVFERLHRAHAHGRRPRRRLLPAAARHMPTTYLRVPNDSVRSTAGLGCSVTCVVLGWEGNGERHAGRAFYSGSWVANSLGARSAPGRCRARTNARARMVFGAKRWGGSRKPGARNRADEVASADAEVSPTCGPVALRMPKKCGVLAPFLY